MRSRIIALQLRLSSTNTPVILIQRHGPSDGVITLNVGGKNFQTLRSTIAQNEVLMDHVVRAEANPEIITSGDHAIFIDRDPKHFGTILDYLRNKADGVFRHPSVAQRLMKFSNNNKQVSADNCQAAKDVTTQIFSIPLPKDSKTLTEMYFESIHYNIPALTDRICSQQSLTRIFETFGSNHPFQMASTAIVAGRRILVLFGGMLTGMGGWLYAQAMAAQAKTNEMLLNTRESCED
mmetsp:Transcript_42525/g.77687  ORF Transcript_42525/g.77687 Transcript_42525/m.77687 type:complete len:236 (+) Transcript_42525:126-833(+)